MVLHGTYFYSLSNVFDYLIRNVFYYIQVLLIFEYEGSCWLFVKNYEGAHQSRRKVSHFQNGTIQNWPCLREVSVARQRYDCIEVNGVESVCFIAPDRHDLNKLWVVRDSDTRLYHEVYADQGDGEEGDVKLLEPDAFAPSTSAAADDSDNSSTSEGSDGDSSSTGDSEESDDLEDVDPNLAREIARDRGAFLWQD